MHANDLIYMAYFDPHQVFDGLTSYIHSMRRLAMAATAPTLYVLLPAFLHTVTAALEAIALTIAAPCVAFVQRVCLSGHIPLVESQL